MNLKNNPRIIIACECDALDRLSFDVFIKTTPIKSLPNSLKMHADLQLHYLGDKNILVCPESFDYYTEKLAPYDFKVIKGESILRCNYPEYVAYNIARIGTFAFHNTKYTDIIAKNYFLKNNIELVHVNQGYTKCSTAVLDANAIITSDIGIHNAAILHNIESLLIEPGYVELKGYEYGFFGGCSFFCAPNIFFVTGSIKNHPSRNNIYKFLEKHSLTLIEGTQNPPLDIGSIICIS